MIDPRSEMILIYSKSGVLEDKTSEARSYRETGQRTYVSFSTGEYPYSPQRVIILRNPQPVQPPPGALVEVRGKTWSGDDALWWRFTGHGQVWMRVFYTTKTGETNKSYCGEDVRIVDDLAQHPRPAAILSYWRDIVKQLPATGGKADPLAEPYRRLTSVHEDSVLGHYLLGEPITAIDWSEPLIFPFSVNLSQREAVEKALHNRISVIDGPPGTGKTQSILNLIANLISHQGKTVGVVSFNNAAVDNVRDKLTAEGFGFVLANLGNKEKVAEFFAGQPARNAEVEQLAHAGLGPPPPEGLLADLDRRLAKLQRTEQELKLLHQEYDAYQLELRHFSHYFQRSELPDLTGLPLLRRSSGRILDYLAETEVAALARDGALSRAIRRVTAYFKYGPTRSVDPRDTDVVLRLQHAFYEKRIAELHHQIAHAQDVLTRGGFDRVAAEHRQLSAHLLRDRLGERYAALNRTEYTSGSYQRQFSKFVDDYPVILSTCHSLRRNIGEGQLLDYLIVDEASQVNLLTAGLALASCRNVVVVGDLRQLRHIADEKACTATAPAPAYDYLQHSLLSSLAELYGDCLPRTMLREHYRCEPAIIGFCNKKFYDGELVPYKPATPGARPLLVVKTVEGNHGRRHSGGGWSNQREVDVIRQEVIPQHCADTAGEDIGITTPYRHQVTKVTAALIDQADIAADTVHKFQGREKDTVIMSTVLDDSRLGNISVKFVDDPHLVNVAVSRASKRFVLVTNHSGLPRSYNLRELAGYIAYHDPEWVTGSQIVSVFDLLYREYSARLRPLAARLLDSSRYKSENIAHTVLQEILADEKYSSFAALMHYRLRNLLPDLTRLTPDQAAYVKHGAHFDFLIYNRITNAFAVAIEVDGFKGHEDDPVQQARDMRKNLICEAHGMRLLRLPTTGSGEVSRICSELDSVIENGEAAIRVEA